MPIGASPLAVKTEADTALLDELLAEHEYAFSKLHAVQEIVKALWPWARFLGITRQIRPFIAGHRLDEAMDLGWLGAVWLNGTKTQWMWEPR